MYLCVDRVCVCVPVHVDPCVGPGSHGFRRSAVGIFEINFESVLSLVKRDVFRPPLTAAV